MSQDAPEYVNPIILQAGIRANSLSCCDPSSEIAPVASTSTDIILDPVPTPASLPVESNGDDALSGLLPQDEFVAVVEEEAGEGVAPIVGTSELAKPNLEEGEEDQTGMVIERERSRSIPAPSPVATRVQTPPPAAPTVEELASKKRKADAADVEAKKRGRRMFGLLQGTLNKAKDQTAQLSRTTQKRQELEERLTLKLAKERTEMEEKRVQGKAAKDLDHEINTKENEIASLDGLVRFHFIAILSLETLTDIGGRSNLIVSDPSRRQIQPCIIPVYHIHSCTDRRLIRQRHHPLCCKTTPRDAPVPAYHPSTYLLSTIQVDSRARGSD